MNLNKNINLRRTFGIISHPDAGKTTLTEKLLLYGGAINEAGAVKSNKIKKTAIPPHSREFVAAVQPPSGGIAPGMAPTDVFSQDFLFKGVYNNKYKKRKSSVIFKMRVSYT